jgi:RecA-family ATPase
MAYVVKSTRRFFVKYSCSIIFLPHTSEAEGKAGKLIAGI